MNGQVSTQNLHVSTSAFERLLAEHPFKDLSNFPGYVPLPHHVDLGLKYRRYVDAVRLFLREKESYDSAFGEMCPRDQSKESQFSAEGSREEERRRLCYGASRVSLVLLYEALEKVAIELHVSLLKGKPKGEMLKGAELSSRELLYECNRIFAVRALGFLLDIQRWLTSKQSRPTHAKTMADGITLLSEDVAALLIATGDVECMLKMGRLVGDKPSSDRSDLDDWVCIDGPAW